MIVKVRCHRPVVDSIEHHVLEQHLVLVLEAELLPEGPEEQRQVVLPVDRHDPVPDLESSDESTPSRGEPWADYLRDWGGGGGVDLVGGGVEAHCDGAR